MIGIAFVYVWMSIFTFVHAIEIEVDNSAVLVYTWNVDLILDKIQMKRLIVLVV